MKLFTSKVFFAFVGILIIVWAFFLRTEKNIVTFVCSDKKQVIATFYPKNDDKVSLHLSDGRVMVLSHLISASGARYGNKDESVIFWNKGDTAFLIEGSSTTFTGCVVEQSSTQTPTKEPESVVATTTTKTKTQQVSSTPSTFTHSYANSEYGFKVKFPPYVVYQPFFSPFYNLASNWRVNATAVAQGKPIASFVVNRIDQGTVATGKNYPLFYVAEVRIGVSPNVKECYATDPGYTSQKVSNVAINGVTWKRFSFSDAGMMKELKGESYRVVHNNTCYVVEQLRHQSTYKDDTMKPGVSEATLDSYYKTAEAVAKTFVFTR
jgi:membrane-bound inhibitor of C-type lysozyme